MEKSLIYLEKEASHEFDLEIESVCDDSGESKDKIVKLNRKNVARVEAMLRYNSAYIHNEKPQLTKPEEKDGNHIGSASYWFGQLKEILIEKKTPRDYSYETVITYLVKAVDKENSTHLNSDRVGYEQISKRIYEIPQEKLLSYLKDPKGTEYELINILSRKTEPKVDSDSKIHGRSNLSFASKFCRWACYYLFERESEQDNYSAYDNVVKMALPEYLEHYGLNQRSLKELSEYPEYQKCIDEIIDEAQKMIQTMKE